MSSPKFRISQSATALFKDSGSKFFAFAYPVQSQTDIKQLLQTLESSYPDATHICFAWSLGKAETRTNDDGEPAHSAGSPILRQIQSRQLTNTLVAVVRYYGGKKLGIPGLIRAYGEAASLALDQATKAAFEIKLQVAVRFGYQLEGEVNKVIRQHHANVILRTFNETGNLTIEVSEDEFASMLATLQGMYGVEIL